MTEFFLDASYAIALASPKDQCHIRAVELAETIRAERIALVTTRAILLEIGNALSKRRFRVAGVVLLEALENDSNVTILPVSDELFNRAFQLYKGRPDKEWGLTDCISFVVMRERGIVSALTTDNDFRQAGFQVLINSVT